MKELVEILQEFLAIETVGPSALRGQGGGVLKPVQKHLGSDVDLRSIPRRSRQAFADWLDHQTVRIPRARWGAARKALNLFIRGCTYNHYLRSEFRLGGNVEKWLEIPLDGVIARSLKRQAGRGMLPPWLGLKNLTREHHAEFQRYAEGLCQSRGIRSRAFLDHYLWLDER